MRRASQHSDRELLPQLTLRMLLLVLIATVVAGFTASPLRAQSIGVASPAPITLSPEKALSASGFIENRGQWSPRALYRTQAPGMAVWITDAGTWLELSDGSDRYHVVNQRFVGASTATIVCGRQTRAPWTFLRNDATYTTRSYEDITYKNIYPGIDARYYQSDGSLKYDLVVEPGADAKRIAVRYEGADATRLAHDGSLRITTSVGVITEAPPQCYQICDGARRNVPASFVLEHGDVRIALAQYDRTRQLVIDPALAFSSYIGGGANDSGHGIAVDAASNVYIGGSTTSSDLETTVGAFSRAPDRAGSLDLFVIKLDASAAVILFGTYLGGSGTDELAALRVHPDSTITLAGTTSSRDFPIIPGAFQATLRGSNDGFITRLSADGGSIVSSTYIGGSGNDRIEDLALNALGQPFVVGFTSSGDLPTTATSAFPNPGGGIDGFAARLAQPPDARNYVTYLGGAGTDHAVAIALGTGGAANIAGWTTSDDLPITAGAAQIARAGGLDGFIMRLRFDGSVLEYGTYLGGTDQDIPADIAIDIPGNQYVVGRTLSADFPVRTNDGVGSWFATRVDSSTGAITTGVGYSRYIGGTHAGSATTIQTTALGGAFIAGSVERASFVTTPDRLQAGPGGALDIGLVRLSSDGSAIAHASVIGGEGNDVPWHESHLTRFNDLYIVGTTSSARFPTTRNAYDEKLNTNGVTARTDAFVLAFRFELRPTIQSQPQLDFDTLRCDTSARDTFYIVNGGEADLIIVANPFATANRRFILEVPDPQATDIRVRPGDSIRYVVRFRALLPGTASDTLLVFSNDSLRSPFRVLMRGVRSSPVIVAQPASITFNRVSACDGESSTRTIRFANTGNDVGIIESVRFARGGPFTVTTPATFPSSIPAARAANFDVRFAPTRQGTFIDTLIATLRGCPNPVRVEVTGVGDSVGFEIVEDLVAFEPLASCTGEIDTAVTVRATGTTGVDVVLASDPGSGFSVVDALPITLQAGETRRLRVRFAPPTGSAIAQARLYLRSIQCGRIDSVLLTGERRPGAALEVPDTVDFGTVALCRISALDSIVDVRIVNNSSAVVDIGVPIIASPFDVENAATFPQAVAAAASTVVRVRFRPLVAGAALDTLVFGIDAGGCRDTIRVVVAAVSSRPLLVPSDTTIVVPTLPDCIAADTIVVRLHNPSDVAATIDSIAATSGVEHLRPTVAFNIAPGETREIFLRFSPQQAGPVTDQITLYTRGCRDSVTIHLSGLKEGSVVVAEPRVLSFAPMLSCAIDSIGRAGVHLKNNGEFDVTIRSAGIEGSSAFTLSDNPGGRIIVRNGDVPVDVRFDPTAVAAEQATLVVVLDPCGDTLRIPIDAVVLDARITVLDGDLGTTSIGTPTTGRLVLRNDLPLRIAIATLDSPQAPFAFDAALNLPINLGPGDSFVVPLRFDPVSPGSYAPTIAINVSEPCAFTTVGAMTGIAVDESDTLTACISDDVAGLAGDSVNLYIDTDEHSATVDGASLDYVVDYEPKRLRFMSAEPATAVSIVNTGDRDGRLRLRVGPGAAFGDQHIRIQFQLLSGGTSAVVRLDSATATGTSVRFAVCTDSASLRISEHCVLTGVSLGRFANRLESARPNPAHDAAEIVFQQLEDAHTRLAIYDLEGREVIRAIDETLAGGRYTVRVDLTSLAAGTYMMRISAGSYIEGRQIVIER